MRGKRSGRSMSSGFWGADCLFTAIAGRGGGDGKESGGGQHCASTQTTGSRSRGDEGGSARLDMRRRIHKMPYHDFVLVA